MKDQSEITEQVKNNYKPLERVTIDDSLKEKLNNLTRLANESLQGIAEVSKSNVINLILQLHDDGLSKQECDELRKTHFDVFKCLTWLQSQARIAKEQGVEVSLNELLDKSREIMVSDAVAPIKIRKPRSRKAKDSDQALEPLQSDST